MLKWVNSAYSVHVPLIKQQELRLLCHLNRNHRISPSVLRQNGGCAGNVYLNVPICQQQVDDDVDWEALHVVQTLLDATQLGRQLQAGVQLPSLADLIQDCLPKVLAVGGKDTYERGVCPEGNTRISQAKINSWWQSSAFSWHAPLSIDTWMDKHDLALNGN